MNYSNPICLCYAHCVKENNTMDKKSEIVNMVEEIYVNCILDYLYVIVRDAHKVALETQTLSSQLPSSLDKED